MIRVLASQASRGPRRASLRPHVAALKHEGQDDLDDTCADDGNDQRPSQTSPPSPSRPRTQQTSCGNEYDWIYRPMLHCAWAGWARCGLDPRYFQ